MDQKFIIDIKKIKKKIRKVQYLLMEYCKEKNLYYQSVVLLYDERGVASNCTPLEVINLINFGSIIYFIEIMDENYLFLIFILWLGTAWHGGWGHY